MGRQSVQDNLGEWHRAIACLRLRRPEEWLTADHSDKLSIHAHRAA
jgi:HK97 family phage major capsid protein